MSRQQTLKFTIRQDGYVTEEVMGVIGNQCQELTKSIEEKLGEVSYVETKPEYYLAQPIDNFWANQDLEVQNNEPVPAWKTALHEQAEQLRKKNRLEN